MNDAGSALPGLLFTAAVFAVAAALHARLGWALARRIGPEILVVSVLAAAVVVTTMLVSVWAVQMAALGVSVQASVLSRNAFYLFAPALVGFTLSGLSIRKSLRNTGDSRPSAALIVRAVVAFFGGFAIILVAALVLDIARL